jgi:hypothetical protein
MKSSLHILELTLLVVLLLAPGNGAPLQTAWSWQWLERDWGAATSPGVYRSYGDLFVDLNPKEDLLIWQENELRLYRDLASRSLRPEYALVELTAYPLAWLSTWMEGAHGEVYGNFDITEDFNLLQSLGSGPEEPWSVSFFLGQIASFWTLNDADEFIVAASGAAGLVATGGWQQIFSNQVVDGPWGRLEWKVKGEGAEGARERSWDLKLGHRWYGLDEIPNTLSVTLERSRTDRKRTRLNPEQNSAALLQLQWPVTEPGAGWSRVLFEYTKYRHLKGHLVGLKAGFLYEHQRPYDGSTGTFAVEREKTWELVLQPQVVF